MDLAHGHSGVNMQDRILSLPVIECCCSNTEGTKIRTKVLIKKIIMDYLSLYINKLAWEPSNAKVTIFTPTWTILPGN